MKKSLLFLALVVVTIVLVSACDKKKAPVLGAKVTITVKNSLGSLQQGTTVYMYKDKEPDKTTKPESANHHVVTDNNGVVTFDLNFTELKILEAQTSLYFVVYYKIAGEDFIAGTQAVTVKRNDTKKLEITIPL